MEAAQLVLPTIATLALGTALFVPLRDDRRGKRATLGGVVPLRPDFRIVATEPPCDALAVGAAATHEKDQLESHHKIERDDDAILATDLNEAPSGDLYEPQITEPNAEPSNHVGSPEMPETEISVARDDREMPLRLDTEIPKTTSALTSLWQRMRAYFASTTPSRERSSPSHPGADLQAIGKSPTEAASESQRSDFFEARSDNDVTIERSFARELELLLTLPQRTERDPSLDRSRASTTTDPLAPNDSADAHSNLPADPNGDRSEFRSEEDGELASNGACSETVIARVPNSSARVVPLTRLPLRPQADRITWPNEYESTRAIVTAEERHALLAATLGGSREVPIGILELAYAQETRDGRILALRAIAKNEPSARTRATFVEALRSGTDDERSLALDALTKHGERTDLIVGLSDRVDAIAARAALSYVGSYDRTTYHEALAPHLDLARIASILALLAGVVE